VAFEQASRADHPVGLVGLHVHHRHVRARPVRERLLGVPRRAHAIQLVRCVDGERERFGEDGMAVDDHDLQRPTGQFPPLPSRQSPGCLR
jgi:hypothetical protein